MSTTNKARSPKSTQAPQAAVPSTVVAAPAPAAAATVPSMPQTAAAQASTLVAVTGKQPRAGTASAAAYAALVASIGQPRAQVLAAVKAAEIAWHTANGRTVKGVAPAGWLRTHGATFSA